MIKSMTAFARAAHTAGTVTAEAVIRSYNSRSLDVAYHCPESCQALEEDIRKLIARAHTRGRIDIRLSVRDEAGDQALYDVDLPRAQSYCQALQTLCQALGLSGGITADHLLTARNLVVPRAAETDAGLLWQAVGPCVEAACHELDLMRQEEGRHLCADLGRRMDDIEDRVKRLEAEAGEMPGIYRQRLMDRLAVLTAGAEGIDPVRLAQEAAILADKSDVSEEITRLRSHISQFRDIMADGESAGRKLNFLIQEFNREFNTIGSKAGKATLSHQVVELKSELEKIREQVQNIE